MHELFTIFVCFFFFKQKTAYEMRISDWSSDVCSSDLGDPREASVSAAIGFLSGQACTTRIADTRSASADRRTGAPARGPDMLVPAKPTTAQRELPGLF